MSVQKVAGTELQYYLVCYDKNGRERDDDPDGLMSALAEKSVSEDNITDVFVISHGWKGDIPAAIEQYDAWIGAMAACAADRQEIRQRRPGFKALLIGFHWPSLPWGEEEFGAGSGGSFALAPGATSGTSDIAQVIDRLIDQYADRIADTPRARDALRTILTAAMNAGPSVTTLTPEVAAAYSALNEEADISAAEEREPFDPNKAFTNARLSAGALGVGLPGMPSFGGFSLSGLLSPLRQLSFWKMKDRARQLGETAGFGLLKGLMTAVPAGRDVRFHLMGHSFGCIVVTSMLNGPDGTGVLPRPVNTLMLVQGATSLWGFCTKSDVVDKPGYFRGVVERNKVSGPIVTTHSKRDTAVGKLYPLAAGVALQTAFPGSFPKYGGLGSFGIQGEGLTLHDLALGATTHSYNFANAHIYNLECTSAIKDGTGASGAHNDIAKPEVAHALWEAVKVNQAI